MIAVPAVIEEAAHYNCDVARSGITLVGNAATLRRRCQTFAASDSELAPWMETQSSSIDPFVGV
jgi:hypothetical protein